MRDSLYAIARICHGNSVCLSVRPSHGWISQKRLKLGPRNFHHTVAPFLQFFGGKFHREIIRRSHGAGASKDSGVGQKAIFQSVNKSLSSHASLPNICVHQPRRVRHMLMSRKQCVLV